MKKKTAKKRGPNRSWKTIRCDWCAEVKETTRVDTKTCSGKCRQRLAFFTRTCGYPPDHAPGPVTGQDAVDCEILRLFRLERDRRCREREYILATGQALPKT
jgi:hypothetical protein